MVNLVRKPSVLGGSAEGMDAVAGPADAYLAGSDVAQYSYANMMLVSDREACARPLDGTAPLADREGNARNISRKEKRCQQKQVVITLDSVPPAPCPLLPAPWPSILRCLPPSSPRLAPRRGHASPACSDRHLHARSCCLMPSAATRSRTVPGDDR